jgi:hypothetical protein
MRIRIQLQKIIRIRNPGTDYLPTFSAVSVCLVVKAVSNVAAVQDCIDESKELRPVCLYLYYALDALLQVEGTANSSFNLNFLKYHIELMSF